MTPYDAVFADVLEAAFTKARDRSVDDPDLGFVTVELEIETAGGVLALVRRLDRELTEAREALEEIAKPGTAEQSMSAVTDGPYFQGLLENRRNIARRALAHPKEGGTK